MQKALACIISSFQQSKPFEAKTKGIGNAYGVRLNRIMHKIIAAR